MFVRRKYLLSDKEFWIEVVSLGDLKYGPVYAMPISATGLKKTLKTTTEREIRITSTLPNVYVEVGNDLYYLSYRPFLSFLAQLSEIEDWVKLDWLVDGF
jgi:hypothetical protein